MINLALLSSNEISNIQESNISIFTNIPTDNLIKPIPKNYINTQILTHTPYQPLQPIYAQSHTSSNNQPLQPIYTQIYTHAPYQPLQPIYTQRHTSSHDQPLQPLTQPYLTEETLSINSPEIQIKKHIQREEFLRRRIKVLELKTIDLITNSFAQVIGINHPPKTTDKTVPLVKSSKLLEARSRLNQIQILNE